MRIKEIETQAPTIEEAIHKGLGELKAEKNEVDIRILDEGSKGLFGLMGAKPAIVQIRLKTTTAPKHDPAGDTIDRVRIQDKLKTITAELLKMMNITDPKIQVTMEEKTAVVSINTSDSAVLIGKQGRTLAALQFIITLMIAREKTTRVSVLVDINGYRKQMEERLTKLAHEAAEEVKRNGKIKQFDPMPAHDRRIIHTALKDYAGVLTESTGDGSFRKVLIKPAEK